MDENSVSLCDCERQELVRLARLGIWAEQKGIPALKFYVVRVHPEDVASNAQLYIDTSKMPAEKALAALPKDPSG